MSAFPEDIGGILELAGWPDRRMGLVCRPANAAQAEARLKSLEAEPVVLSGLWLYCGCFSESHTISQEIHTPEGSYWHGILHRQEPDDFNAGYWFKRVGRHPIFAELSGLAGTIGYEQTGNWDPFEFIEFCSGARSVGGDRERLAVEVQHIEFALLLSWCLKHGRMK